MTHWFFDTAGIGSLIVFAIGISVFIAYLKMLRWIQTAPPPSTGGQAVDPDAGTQPPK